MFKTNHIFFKNSFFPSTIIEWNNLDPNLRNSDTYGASKNTILEFIRPSPNNVFESHNPQGIKFLTRLLGDYDFQIHCLESHNPQGIKFLTRLRLGLIHLHEHKFKHSFQDSPNRLCKCGAEVESTTHLLLHCPIYNNDWSS